MAYVDNEEVNVYYGKIDFYSIKGEVMKTLYYDDNEEFDKELKDSYKIGQPINGQIIPCDNYLEKKFDEEGDLDELFDAK